jgi:predicted transposase YbfD/YdcC
VESGNHYLAQVKRNQPSLCDAVEAATLGQLPLDHHEEHQSGHGRQTDWYTYIYNAHNSSKVLEWKGLRRFIHVRRVCRYTKNNKVSYSDRYYISDLPDTSASFFHDGIRGHWKIENSLHWVKDVVHNEDGNRIRSNNAPINCSIISTMAINVHRKNGNWSITQAQIIANADIRKLFQQIRT